MKKISKEDLAIAERNCREAFPPGSVAYTVLRHVSSSGMQRRISVLGVMGGEIVCLDWAVSRVLGRRVHPNGGIIIGGCGMDMGFALIYDLTATLYGIDAAYSINHRWI